MDKKAKNKLITTLLLLVLAIIVIFLYKNIFDFGNFFVDENSDELRVHFIDIGQGDAILVQFNDKNMLIDSGPKKSSDKILKYLDSLNIKTIDVIIGSHPHEDHMGNMAAIVKKYSVLSFFSPKVSVNQYFFENLAKELNNKNLKITPVHAGTTINFDPDIDIDVYWPEENKSYENLNNYSIVMSLRYRNISFLFAGDIEKDCEKIMIANGGDFNADVLKIAHHGSKTSSTKKFLDKVNGKYAIIQCGLNNQYGHPDKTTISELTSRGYKIYRNDLNGNIVVITNGNTIDINTNK